MENKFIIECFLQGAQHQPFQNHWMAIDELAELINTHYQIPEAACFNGQKLKNVLTCCRWPNANIESRGSVYESI
jgi:hypothetical protein